MYKINYHGFTKKITDSLIMIIFFVACTIIAPIVDEKLLTTDEEDEFSSEYSTNLYDGTTPAMKHYKAIKDDSIIYEYYSYKVDDQEYQCTNYKTDYSKIDKTDVKDSLTDATDVTIYYRTVNPSNCYYKIEEKDINLLSIAGLTEYFTDLKNKNFNLLSTIILIMYIIILLNIISIIKVLIKMLKVKKLSNSKTAVLVHKVPIRFQQGIDDCPTAMLSMEDGSVLEFKADFMSSTDFTNGVNGFDLLVEPKNQKKYFVDFHIGRLNGFDVAEDQMQNFVNNQQTPTNNLGISYVNPVTPQTIPPTEPLTSAPVVYEPPNAPVETIPINQNNNYIQPITQNSGPSAPMPQNNEYIAPINQPMPQENYPVENLNQTPKFFPAMVETMPDQLSNNINNQQPAVSTNEIEQLVPTNNVSMQPQIEELIMEPPTVAQNGFANQMNNILNAKTYNENTEVLEAVETLEETPTIPQNKEVKLSAPPTQNSSNTIQSDDVLLNKMRSQNHSFGTIVPEDNPEDKRQNVTSHGFIRPQ